MDYKWNVTIKLRDLSEVTLVAKTCTASILGYFEMYNVSIDQFDKEYSIEDRSKIQKDFLMDYMMNWLEKNMNILQVVSVKCELFDYPIKINPALGEPMWVIYTAGDDND